MRTESQKLKSAESLRQYRKTPKGKATTMWNAILYRLKYESSYKDVQLNLTRPEFLSWVIPQLENWCLTKPIEDASLDRIDNAGHYEIPNLQLLSRKDNNLKRSYYKFNKAPVGTVWCTSCQDYLQVSMFSKCRTSITGFKNYCKSCAKQYWKTYSANVKNQK